MFASDSELVEDVRKAPDDVLSITAAMVEVCALLWMPDLCSKRSSQILQTEYTLDPLAMDDKYHASVIRSKLTRNIASTFKQVRDEFVKSLEALHLHGDGVCKVLS